MMIEIGAEMRTPRQESWQSSRRFRPGVTLIVAAGLLTACGASEASAGHSIAVTPSVTATATASAVATATPAVGSIVPEAVFEPDLTVGTLLTAHDAVWAFDWTGVTRIDPATNQVVRFTLKAADGSERPSVFGAVGFGSIWVGDFDKDEVRRYDESSGVLTMVVSTAKPEGLVVAGDAVWVTNHHTGSVSRIDPATNLAVATVKLGREGNSGPERIIAAGGNIWTGIPNELAVGGIDPESNKSLGLIKVLAPGIPCGDISVHDNRLYISGCGDAQALSVVDISAMTATGSPTFAGSVTAPVDIDDQLWLGVAGPTESEMTSLDPISLEVGRSIPVSGGAPTVLLQAFDSLWVAIELESAQRAWLLRLPVIAFE
jgi:YVTN family beta-propeller protein